MNNSSGSKAGPSGTSVSQYITRLDQSLIEEVDLLPKSALALTVIYEYGVVDLEGLRKVGVLKRGEGLRRSLEPLIEDGWIQESKVKAQPGAVRQRSVWSIHPAKKSQVTEIFERALARFHEKQRDCHSYLSKLRELPLESLEDASGVNQRRMSVTLKRNPGMPTTTFIQFVLSKPSESRDSNAHRVPGIAVKAVNERGTAVTVKQGHIWNFTDRDLAEAQARSIATAGSAWPAEAKKWPLEKLTEELERRHVDFEPLTMHQLLKQVAPALKEQSPAMPRNARVVSDRKNNEVIVEHRLGVKDRKSGLRPWEPLHLRIEDFAPDITMADLRILGSWFARYRVKDPCLARWTLAPKWFNGAL